MTTVVGAVAPDAATHAPRLRRAAGDEPELVVEDGAAVAWAPGAGVAAARSGSVVCVAAGTVEGGIAATRLAAAFARAGDAGIAGLRGTFAAFLWEPAAGRGRLVADQLGTRTIVYRVEGATTWFAFDVHDLLALLDSTPAPSTVAMSSWLANGTTPPSMTLYEGVERVPGGHALELDSGRPRVREYWRPRYVTPERLHRSEAEAVLRTEIAAAAVRAHGDDPERAVLLSGGLDSAAVTAVASPSHAYSLVFPGEPEIDESHFIAHLTAELNVPSTTVEHRAGSLLAAARDYVRMWRLPPVAPTLAVQRPLLEAAARGGAGVLLDGQGGDELFGSRVELLADLLRRGRIRTAVRLAHRIDGIPDHVRSRAARRALRDFGVKEALPRRARLLARHVRSRPSPMPWVRAAPPEPPRCARGPRWWTHLVYAVTVQREWARAHDHLRHRNTMAGVVGAHPFLQDLDLIELVLRLPPELAFDPTHDRALLRGAMRGLVPDRVLARRDKAFFTPLLVRALAETDAGEIRRLVLAPDAEIRAYVDQRAVREHLVDAAPSVRGGAWGWALWRLTAAELWLRAEAGKP